MKILKSPKALKTMVGVENNILICDTLIIEGVKWLVPHWTEAPAEGWKKPTRMIRPNQDWFDDLGDDYPADFLLKHSIPKDVFDGSTSTLEFVVDLDPQVKIHIQKGVH